MTDNLSHEELLRLLADYCNGQLGEENARRLNLALAEDENARRIYLEYMDIHSFLAWESTSAADLPALHRNIRPSPRGGLYYLVSTPQRLALSVATLALIAILSLLAFTPVQLFKQPIADLPPPPDRVVAAIITATVDCQWEETSLPVGHGSKLSKGQQIHLLSGTAEITFDSGAVVTLTGPSLFVVDAQSLGTLRRGKLAAHVPPRAKGFSVCTPSAIIVDLGTEFGVQVASAEEGRPVQEEVHVFTGLLDLTFQDSTIPPQKLRTKEALRISSEAGQTVVKRLPAAASREQFPHSIKREGDSTSGQTPPPAEQPPVTGGLALWLAAHETVRRDISGGVLIWEDILVGDNKAAQNATQHNSARRPLWMADAIGGKPAIRFDGNDSLALATPSSLEILSGDYEIFVVARTASPNIQFLIGGGVEDFELHLNGEAGARFIPAGYNSSPLNASDLAETGRFSDGAAHVFSARLEAGNGHRAIVSVDGADSGDLVDHDARSANNTSLRIGMRHNITYGFEGEIAEVLIYRRSLTSHQRRAVNAYLARKYAIGETR